MGQPQIFTALLYGLTDAWSGAEVKQTLQANSTTWDDLFFVFYPQLAW